MRMKQEVIYPGESAGLITDAGNVTTAPPEGTTGGARALTSSRGNAASGGVG